MEVDNIVTHFFLPCGSLTLFVAALLVAAVSDAKTRLIPNVVPFLLLVTGALDLLARALTVQSIVSALLGMFLGGFPLFILAIFRGTIGGGDVKLAATAGFALGWLGSYVALMAALIGFVLFGLFHLPGKKAKENDVALLMPFAPFYAVAGIGVCLLSFVFRHSLTL
jgi:leader peptidase (prepilin peptidase)/N-methyltransferase